MRLTNPNRSVALVVIGCLLYAPVAQSFPQSPQAKPAANTAQQGFDKLLAPVALYPDSLLAQVLACATSPQQLTEVNTWLGQNTNLQGTQLQEAATAKGFDASFVAIVLFPDVVTMMTKNMEWTTEVGKAFLSDQKAVLESVQRLRAQAQAAGNLKTNEQQTVKSENQEGTQVIVIQPTNPQVVYVPVYNTQVVYAPAPPPPPSSSGQTAAAALIGFGLGIAVGAAMNNNYYYGGWGMGWHSHTVVVAGGGAWRVPPNHRYPYTARPAGAYHPRPVNYNNVNVNVNRNTNVNNNTNVNRNNVNSANVNTARPTTASNAARPAATEQRASRPTTSGSSNSAASRGYQQPNAAATSTAERSGTKSSAFSGYQSGGAERSASQRGQASASSSGRSRSGGRR